MTFSITASNTSSAVGKTRPPSSRASCSRTSSAGFCRVLEITENGVALDTLITELTRRDPPVLTALKAKRARAAAGLRTSAAHARWEEIDRGDVAPVIELTKELIGTHLA